jgi:DNA-directed RNA polymerase subunit RPC12/RpoP
MTYLYEAIEPTRLYIKQCSHCGLKYFGKTKSSDIHSYPGSGTYWSAHLEKHNAKPIHLWHSDWYHDTSITRFALKFSRINKIVESNLWANLMDENGLDGGQMTQESILKRIETRKLNGTLNPNTPESIQKQLETKRKNGTLNPNTQESLKKQLETKRKNGTLNSNTSESREKAILTRIKNGKLNTNTPESVEKQLETKRKNGTLNPNTQESIRKGIETKRKNGTLHNNEKLKGKIHRKVTCPYCDKVGGLNAMNRWHFENCAVRQTDN